MNKQDRDCIETMHNYMLSDNDYLHGDRTEINHICSRLEKLGQLEDIEEELGIDLAILFKAFKALKNGFYDENEEYHHFSNLFIDNIEIFDSYEKVSFNLKDYGKTWALTKEELE